MAVAHVGISGWRYPPWRGVWYPKGLPQRSELEYSSSRLNSIELNGSFYALQRPSSYQSWYDATPDEFVFSVKGGRFITHLLKLTNVEQAMANFFASGVLALRDKLGPMLWQLPERHAFDVDQLTAFFDLIPRTTDQALAMARRHDERLDGRTWLTEQPNRPIRHALEPRHADFAAPAAAELCRSHDIGLVVADTAGKWPQIREITSDFVYVRLHGAEELYASGYTDVALDRWATDIRGWMNGSVDGRARDAYVYFDNDIKVRAPFDALELAARLNS
ncbi:MAG: hypothetical protein JWR36_186 [Glaciihabitans sp.]|nr:hypothetical protein [Glaciihabitans sp.]